MENGVDWEVKCGGGGGELFLISLFSWRDLEWNTKELRYSSFLRFKLVFYLLFHSVTMYFGGLICYIIQSIVHSIFRI